MSGGDSSFEGLLAGIISNNNEERRRAETAYNEVLDTQPAVVVANLLRCLENGQAELLRTTCAVLLRRVVVPSSPYWSRHNGAEQTSVRAGLLSALGKEHSKSIARKICYAVASAASPEAGPWPELFPSILCSAQSSDQEKRALAFFLLQAMTETSPIPMSKQATSVLQVCAPAVADLSHLATATAAFKASAAVLQIMANEQEESRFKELLPHMLQVLSSVLSAGYELEAQEMLESLAELADVSPLFFSSHVAPVAEGMLAVGSTSQLEFGTRAAGVEVLLTLAERAPIIIRTSSTVAPGLIPLALALMCELNEDQTDWVQGPYDDDVDHDEEGAYGVEALCRLITALHAKTTMPTALGMIPQYLGGADWRQRRAGLCTLGALVDCATNAMKEHIPSVSEAAMSLLEDISPRVRFQALQVIGRLSDLYPVEFQGVYHEKVIPAVCRLVTDASQPVRVRGHAASAIVNLTDTEGVPEESIAPYLDMFLSALCSCLNGGGLPQSVQCRALTAVACVAKMAEADFGKYYDAFIPGIKAIVTVTAPKAGTEPENDLLLGQATQCAGIIGEAVGRTRFRTDGLEIMSTLMGRLGKSGDHSQFLSEHVAPACGNLCRALGEDLAMFLPVVLPLLVADLEAKVKFSIEAAEPDEDDQDCITDEQTGTQTAVVKIRGIGPQRVTLSTFAIASKETAARMLFEYAGALKEAFIEHVPTAASALIPAVTFRFNEDVRSAAALALGKVYESAMQGDLKTATQLLSPCVTVLLEALKGEFQDEIRSPDSTKRIIWQYDGLSEGFLKILITRCLQAPRSCMSSALRDVLCACYESGGVDEATGAQDIPKVQVPLEAAAAISEELVAQVKASLKRRTAKEGNYEIEEVRDEEDTELLEEELAHEEEVMEHLVDSLGYLLKGHGPAFLHVFDKITAPMFAPLLGKSQPKSLRWNAVCAFDDVIEQCGEGAHKYLPTCFPAFVEGMVDESSPMIQMASVYGIQQTAKHAPAFFIHKCEEVLTKLVGLVNRPDAKDEDSLLVTENAVAAIGTICVSPNLSARVDRSRLLPLWLSHLPLKKDETEARVVHRTLCELVERRDPALLGGDLGQVSAVISVFAHILEIFLRDSEATIVDAPTAQRIGHLLQGMQTSMPASVMERAWSGLTPGQKVAIQQAARC